MADQTPSQQDFVSGLNQPDPAPVKGFFRVTGPDGSYVDFPEGTPDSKVNEVMAQAYAPKAPVTAPNAPVNAGGGDKPKSVVMGSLSDPRISDKQRQAAQEWMNTTRDYDPKAAPGSPGNPLFNLPGATPPVGASYWDENGNLQQNAGVNDEWGGFNQGVMRPLDNTAVWLKNAVPFLRGLDNASHEYLGTPTAEETRQQHEDWYAERQQRGYKPGMLGEMGGGAIGAAPVLLATRNPWLVGAASNALESKNPNDPVEVGTNAATGAIGGKVGDVVTRGVGSAIAPTVNPIVRRLLDANIELTPGQIVGGLPHRAEDATRSIYGLGDLVINAQKRGQDSFVRAATQEALTPIGVELPKDVPTGHAAIDFAQKTLSHAYDTVLPQVAVTIDPALSADVRASRIAARGLPKDQARVFNRFLRDVIQPKVGSGQLNGQTFKDIEESLGREAKLYRSGNATPDQRKLAELFEDVQEGFRNLVARQNPQAAKAIGAINDGYANLVRVETAAGQAATGGIFTPSGLRSIVSSPRFTSRRSAARAAGRLQQLADDASGVMKSTVPDSGTMTRALATGAAGYALFGTGNLSHPINVNPWASAGLAAAALPYSSRSAGRIATSILTKRPPGAAVVRRGVDAFARSGVPSQLTGQYPGLTQREQELAQ